MKPCRPLFIQWRANVTSILLECSHLPQYRILTGTVHRMPLAKSSPSNTGNTSSADCSGIKDLSVIIVNYNVKEFLEQALRSVEKAVNNHNVEIFVVDNNSVDGSVELVKEQFPDVILISNRENVGFSKANNQAIRQAKGRYLLILNPDTILQEDTIEKLLRYMDGHPECGAAGCKILNPDGTFALESRRSFPTPIVAFYRITGLSRLFPRSKTFGKYNLSYLPIDAPAEVDALSGSCMLVRHDALYSGPGKKSTPAFLNPDQYGGGAGLFDEAFFMYGEDLDWCYRIKEAGWEIHYTPSTQIIHYKGESTKKGELRYVKLFYGAMLRFSEKHFKQTHSHFFRAFLRTGILTRAALQVVVDRYKKWRFSLLEALLLAVIVFITGFFRYNQLGRPLPTAFYGIIPLLYAAAAGFGIRIAQGYTQSKIHSVHPVLLGYLLGLFGISTISFFFKSIAFSRWVVLLSFLTGAILVSLFRIIRRRDKRGLSIQRRLLLVSDELGAARLQNILKDNYQLPYSLAGFVRPTRRQNEQSSIDIDIPELGEIHQLRELVRLEDIDDLVFDATSLTNELIFREIQKLKDLNLNFRILTSRKDHLIGRASIDDLSGPPLIEAERAVGSGRSRLARRSFEISMSFIGLLMHPLLRLIALLWPNSGFKKLSDRTKSLPQVVNGKKVLIGTRTSSIEVPAEWNLSPGVFFIEDTLQESGNDSHTLHQAYWYYVRNQSALLDWAIIRKSIHAFFEKNP